MPITNHIEFIDPKQIVVGPRQRSETNVDGLIESVRRHHILVPLIVTHIQSEIDAPLQIALIAGRRRLACALELNLTLVPVRFYETLSNSEMKVIELEENIKREDLPWKDRVRAIGQLHALKLVEDDSWTVEQLAELISYSRRHVNDILTVYTSLETPAIATAETLSHAISTAARLAERRNEAITEDLLRAPISVQNFNIQSDEEIAAEVFPEQQEREMFLSYNGTELITIRHNPFGDDEILEIRPNTNVEFTVTKVQSSPIIVDDFLTWSENYAGPKFNLIHCDFPLERFEQFINTLTDNINRIFSHSGHILLWFDFDLDYGTISGKLSGAGLYVIDHPLIWMRSDVKNSTVPGAEPKHSYEAAILAYRGGRPLICQHTNCYSAQAVASPIHPQQKPEPMLRHFLAMLIDPVTDFLDPTAGSGSALRAAEDLGARSTLGIELNPEHAAAANTATLRARLLRRANSSVKL